MSDNADISELLDRARIQEVLAAYATGLDAKDWVLWRSVFTDEVIFDLSSWNGRPPRPLDTDRVVASQARLWDELIVSQHFMTNFRITVEGDKARALAHMRAEHWIDVTSPEGGSGRYTMFGYYDDKLLRTPDGWKITEMQLNVTRTEGDRWVLEEAANRVRRRKIRVRKRKKKK